MSDKSALEIVREQKAALDEALKLREAGGLPLEWLWAFSALTRLHAAVEREAKELKELREWRDNVLRLPEQEWASVGAILMQILASAARQGFDVKATDAVAAIDRAKAYERRLRDRAEAAEARAERLAAALRDALSDLECRDDNAALLTLKAALAQAEGK